MRNWQWVRDAEMDGLEYMHGDLAHNWAGYGLTTTKFLSIQKTFKNYYSNEDGLLMIGNL